jgi:hypothetical protein
MLSFRATKAGRVSVKITSVSLPFFLSICSLGQSCKSGGDCQQGKIAGPYSTSQVAEYTSTGVFPVCTSQSCTSGSWSGNQIEGIDAQQNIDSQYQFYDRALNFDANIAVGRSRKGKNAQVLEWVNYFFVQAFDKVTGQPIFTTPGGTTAVPQSVVALWSTSTQPECRSGSGNVQIIYDRLDDRFVISRRVSHAVGGINHYAWCVAASSNSDLSNPNTKWHAYEYKMDSVIPCVWNSNNCTTGTNYYYFPDWPRIGTWSNGFYITFDLSDPNTASELPIGFEACQLDRVHMVRGGPSDPMTCYTYMVPPAQEPSLIHSVDVADIDSAKQPPSGAPEYFLAMVNPSDAQQAGDGRGPCTSQTTPCASNQLALFNWQAVRRGRLKGPGFVSVLPYTPGCYDTSAPGREVNTICVPEPSTDPQDVGAYGTPDCFWFSTPCIDSLGDRLANRLTYSNLASTHGGPNGEYLTASQVVMESATNQRVGIRYYILQASNGAASVLVNSGGASEPPDLQDPNGMLFYFMPSAALDKNGNLGIAYTSSGEYCASCGTQPNPAINFDVLPWNSSTLAPPTTIIEGAGDEENNGHWGEYAATVLDSTSDLMFYGVGQYFNTSETGTTNCRQPSSNCDTWLTRIFRAQYGEALIAPRFPRPRCR